MELLKNKKFYNKDDMEKIKIVEETTQTGNFQKNRLFMIFYQV